MLNIVADENIPYLRGVLESYANVRYMRGESISRKDIQDADILIVRTRTDCSKELLDGTCVKYIATATIGTDHIDTSYCQEAEIEVHNAAGCNAAGVLQWVSAVLALLSAEEGWKPSDKVLGVIGVGNVGSVVARYARDWGFTVLMSDPPREKREGLTKHNGFWNADHIYRNADILSFHVPLAHDGKHATFGMLAEPQIAKLKKGAAVLNASRGGVVSEDALLEFVVQRSLKLCIDTWTNEPCINGRLLSASLVSTPHVAGYTAQGKANATSMVVNQLADRFGFPIRNWYPAQVVPVGRKNIGWDTMCAGIAEYYDILAESRALKNNPGIFETLRREYFYREEFF